MLDPISSTQVNRIATVSQTHQRSSLYIGSEHSVHIHRPDNYQQTFTGLLMLLSLSLFTLLKAAFVFMFYKPHEYATGYRRYFNTNFERNKHLSLLSDKLLGFRPHYWAHDTINNNGGHRKTSCHKRWRATNKQTKIFS